MRQLCLEKVVKDEDLVRSSLQAGTAVDVPSHKGLGHPFVGVSGRGVVEQSGNIVDNLAVRVEGNRFDRRGSSECSTAS